jgi:hypothetical protein
MESLKSKLSARKSSLQDFEEEEAQEVAEPLCDELALDSLADMNQALSIAADTPFEAPLAKRASESGTFGARGGRGGGARPGGEGAGFGGGAGGGASQGKTLFSSTTTSNRPMAPLSHRQRVTAFFEKYNPSKLASVDTLLTGYAGKEEDLLGALVAKYGPEPGSALPASSPFGSARTSPPTFGLSLSGLPLHIIDDELEDRPWSIAGIRPVIVLVDRDPATGLCTGTALLTFASVQDLSLALLLVEKLCPGWVGKPTDPEAKVLNCAELVKALWEREKTGSWAQRPGGVPLEVVERILAANFPGRIPPSASLGIASFFFPLHPKIRRGLRGLPIPRLCPRGHVLAVVSGKPVHYPGWCCDVCKAGIPHHEQNVLHCHDCSYDVCPTCAAAVENLHPSCAKGHRLIQIRQRPAHYRGWACDRCSSAIPENSPEGVLHCATCSYDLCPTCTQKAFAGVLDANEGSALPFPPGEAETALLGTARAFLQYCVYFDPVEVQVYPFPVRSVEPVPEVLIVPAAASGARNSYEGAASSSTPTPVSFLAPKFG